MSDPNIVIIDASAFIYRAYHGFPRVLHERTGMNVGAVSGFTNMLWGQVKRILDPFMPGEATHIVVVFDHPSKNHRHEIYPQYKANRSSKDDEILSQLPLCRRAAQAFNLPCIEIEGYEADDIIATISTMCSSVGMDVLILSADKDLMQLIGPMVHMWDPIKKARIGSDAVFEKFGVYPDEMVDFQALLGDSVDNIPGVDGIGAVTAAALIRQWGSLDEILANWDKVKVSQKRRQSLRVNGDAARLSRRLAELKTDVPIDRDIGSFEFRRPDMTDLKIFMKRMQFIGRWEEWRHWLNRYG